MRYFQQQDLLILIFQLRQSSDDPYTSDLHLRLHYCAAMSSKRILVCSYTQKGNINESWCTSTNRKGHFCWRRESIACGFSCFLLCFAPRSVVAVTSKWKRAWRRQHRRPSGARLQPQNTRMALVMQESRICYPW